MIWTAGPAGRPSASCRDSPPPRRYVRRNGRSAGHAGSGLPTDVGRNTPRTTVTSGHQTVVVTGWAPYRFRSSWVYGIAPVGLDLGRWTRLGVMPPFHYAAWVQWNSAWCWVPGPAGVYARCTGAPPRGWWPGWGGPAGRGLPWRSAQNRRLVPASRPREVYVPGLSREPHLRAQNVNITNTERSWNNTYITKRTSEQRHQTFTT